MARSKTTFKPGQSGNPKGRPPEGETARNWVSDFLEKDEKKAVEDWKKLSPSARWNIRVRLFDFKYPKLRAETLDMNIDGMSDQFAGKIIAEVLQKSIHDEVRFTSPDERGKDNTGDNS